MNKLIQYYNKAIELIIDIFNTGKGDYFGNILFAISISSLYWLLRKPLEALLRRLLNFRDKQFIIPRTLRTYKAHLDNETYSLNHSWKLANQTLKEIIVPIYINNNERISLIDYINDLYSNYNYQKKIHKIILLGEGGSGKSVAMGEIARKIWEIKRTGTLLPVILKFSEIKNVKSKNDFENAIVKNLERNQFENGKNTNKAKNYVSVNLYNGTILLLLDGLDELEKTSRIEITQFLNDFLRTYPHIPAIISCRISVWKKNSTIFHPIEPLTIHLASFTSSDIRLFISQWKFEGNKSGHQLAEIINEKSYLKTIATRPLMLSIITFLYAQADKVLPDKRIKFYDECVEALLEKWDNAKPLDRENIFEKIDKVEILSYLGYQHIVEKSTTEDEISNDKILVIIENVMRGNLRPIHQREQMLNELVENSELLIFLPPDCYKFPHRTFMEYFAARYIAKQNKIDLLLDLYYHDSGKWEETLCLFSGLNTDYEIASKIFKSQIKDFETYKQTPELNTAIFRLLVESSKIDTTDAEYILDLADYYLGEKINNSIVENLGYIAINKSLKHSEKAKGILLKHISKSTANHYDFQILIMALGHLKDPDIQNAILSVADKINIVDFLTNLGEDSEIYAQKLLDNLEPEKSIDVLEGLKKAGNIEFLINLMVKSTIETIQQEAAYQLATVQNFDYLDKIPFDEVEINLKKEAINQYNELGWNYSKPYNINSKRSIFLISILLSKLLSKTQRTIKDEVNNAISFLTFANLIKNNNDINFCLNRIPFFSFSNAKYEGLIVLWKKSNWFIYVIFIASILSIISFFYSINALIKTIHMLYLILTFLTLSILVGIIISKVSKEEEYFSEYMGMSITLLLYFLLTLPILSILLEDNFKYSVNRKINFNKKKKNIYFLNIISIIISFSYIYFLSYSGTPIILCYLFVLLNIYNTVKIFFNKYIYLYNMIFFSNSQVIDFLDEKKVVK